MAEFIHPGLRPVGVPLVMAENPWFSVMHQPVDIHDPLTGELKKSASEGGQQNYLHIAKPGVLVVVDLGGKATLLAGQERYTTNLVEGQSVRHYELPGGGFDTSEYDEEVIKKAARDELGQELGYDAEEYVIVGPKHRGLMAHPYINDHNFTVVARGAEPLEAGATLEDTEVIGAPEAFTWAETHDMSLNEHGLYVPKTDEFKVISAATTVASLALAERFLAQRAGLDPRTIV